MVAITASVVARKALRYTPAGLPAVDLRLAHSSEVVEAGVVRKVSLELPAVALGPIAEVLLKHPLGTVLELKGFLAMTRNKTAVLLHITELSQT